jgi:4-amino-4-deoxy-L-arabinose transferase-like glycosyltransferase
MPVISLLNKKSVRMTVLILFAVLPYLPACGYDFALDDHHLISVNPRLSSWSDVTHYVTEAHYWQKGYSAYFRPMVYLSLMANYRISGMHPWSYHVLNILLHCAATLLVYVLAGIISDRFRGSVSSLMPWLAALLFAIHPVHSEAVVNVAGRADIMMTCWILLGLLCAVKGYEGTRPFAWLVCPCALAAALTKETGFLLMPLVAVWDWSFNRYRACRKYSRRHVWAAGLLGSGIAAMMYIAAVSTADTSHTTSYLDNFTCYQPLFIRLQTSLYLIGHSIRLLIFPYPLSADYSYAQIAPVNNFLTSYAALASGVILCMSAWAWKRPVTSSRKICEFGLLWFLVAYLPSSNLFFPIGTIFGERLLYLASVGFCILIGWMLARFIHTEPAWKSMVVVVAGLVVIAGASWILIRSRDWRNNDALYLSMVRTAPRSAKAHFSLARYYATQHNYPAARKAISTALHFYSLYPEAHSLQAGILMETGDYTNAFIAARRAVELNWHTAEAHYYLGILYMRQGQPQLASNHFNVARSLRPGIMPGKSIRSSPRRQ